MARVLVTYRILPKSTDVNLDLLLKEIKEKFEVYSSEIQPIAFGIKALIVKVLLPEEEGSTDKFESELKKINGVGEIELQGFTRVE